MSGVRRLILGVHLMATLLVPWSARAADSTLTLAWTAPPTCPDREQVLARAARLLGREPGRSLERALTVQASVERLPDDSWQLQLTLGDHSPARVVTASSCEELGDAAALLIALSIDPNLDPSGAAPAAGPVVAPEPEPAKALRVPPAPAPAVPPATPAPTNGATAANRASVPLELRFSAALALWTGRLPGLAPGAMVRASVVRKRLSLSADLGFFPPQHAGITGSEAGGELWLASAGSKLGYAFTSDSATLVPQLGLELQWVRGAGSGVEHPSSAQALLVSVEAGGRAGLVLSRHWNAFAEGAVSVLAWRPGFVLDRIGDLYRPDRVGLRFGLGGEWRAW